MKIAASLEDYGEVNIFKLHGCEEEKIYLLPNMVCFRLHQYLLEACSHSVSDGQG